MEEDKGLDRRLLEDIKKTGYPAEILAGNVFLNNGWQVHYNSFYIDLDENKGREIDLEAFKQVSSKEYDVYVALNLVAEVKKTEDHPWVIFSTERTGDWEEPGWGRMHVSDKQIDHFDVLSCEQLEEQSSLHHFQRFGHSFYEGFKGTASKSTIFDALASSVKASEYHLTFLNEISKDDDKLSRRKGRLGGSVQFVEPIVILDGQLYEAHLDVDNELRLDKVDCIPVCFEYLSPKYKRFDPFGFYVVEIVTMDGLAKLLSKKTRWLNHIKKTIIKNLAKQK